jgi:pimeloyl-ACP methyl ester carboxylesterase
MPAPIRPLLSKALPGVLAGAAKGRRAILVERSRRVTDLAFLGSRVLGFGDGEISPAVISFLGEMVSATPIEVVARFGQALLLCDKRDALATIGRVPTTVMVAEKDRLISPRLGIELAMDIPGSHLTWVPGAGHAVILERPGLVNDAITGMLAQVGAGGNLPRSA